MPSRVSLPLMSAVLTAIMTLILLCILIGPQELIQAANHKLQVHAPNAEPTGKTEPAAAVNHSDSQQKADLIPSYQIDAVLNPSLHQISGHEVVTLPHPSISDLHFYLFSPAGAATTIQVNDVQINLKRVSFSTDSGDLIIPNIPQNKPVALDIAFSTTIPVGPTRFGEYEGIWSLDYWYPILAVQSNGKWIAKPDPQPFGDPFLMDLGRYTLKLRSPGNYRWFASASQSKTESIGTGETLTTWGPALLRNMALIGSAEFNEHSFSLDEGTKVTVAAGSEKDLDSIFSAAKQSAQFYRKLYGPLSSPVLSVLVMPSGTVYAHEYPYLALVSKNTLSWSSGDHWLAHEIAHAWWFSEVGTYKALHPWLDEGLAEYSALLYEESVKGKSSYLDTVKTDWNLFRSSTSYSPHSYGEQTQVGDLKMDSPYAAFTTDSAYYQMEYLRSQLMYADLRRVLGDDKFFAFLRKYYENNRQQTASPDSLVQALKSVSPEAVPLLTIWMNSPNRELIEIVKGRFSS